MIDHNPDHLEYSATWEQQYLDLVEDILRNGNDRVDRTGVGTRAVFGKRLDIDLSKGFPAVTTKKLAWKSVLTELLWFLEGTGDERRLAEILHGTRDAAKRTIWTDNAEASYWKPKAKYEGDLGRVYGVNWREWLQYEVKEAGETIDHLDGAQTLVNAKVTVSKIDQVAELVNKLKNNPYDRRMIISAWNVAELGQMALPPCHMMAQFFVRDTPTGKKLSCQMYQRSVDTMLGLPFNIASYALLTHMLAHVTGMGVDRLIMDLGDTHIYSNHLEAAKIQLNRRPTKAPHLLINPEITDIDKFTVGDIVLNDYVSQDAIKMDMAV